MRLTKDFSLSNLCLLRTIFRQSTGYNIMQIQFAKFYWILFVINFLSYLSNFDNNIMLTFQIVLKGLSLHMIHNIIITTEIAPSLKPWVFCLWPLETSGREENRTIALVSSQELTFLCVLRGHFSVINNGQQSFLF